MEAKKFISTLKGFRTRFTNKPNAELEKKSVEGVVERVGGKLEAIALLNEAQLDDDTKNSLKQYMKSVLGIETVKPSAKVVEVKDDGTELAVKDGKLYKLDTVKKTMKRVYKDLSAINLDDVELEQMPMTVYQRYLKDHFDGESCTIKKGNLMFRGYRISCTKENGFMVEDTENKYQVVETPWEGVPTPKELGEWFKKPKVEHTPEQLREAIERGKELARKAQEERERNAREAEEAEEEPDYEALRRKVLNTIKGIRSNKLDFDPTKFPEMIPFRRWKRKVNSLLTQWKDRKIRYAKFINELEKTTTEETFVVEEKKHRSSFKGTLLPEHKKVGMLVGNNIEVDGKWIDAVPFLLEYLLFHEKRAMSQIMKYAAGEITDVELIKNPLEVDWKVEYKKRALENTAHNARVLCMVYDAVSIVAPQDLLYEADLQVGDRVMVSVNGELKTQTVASVDRGIILGKEIGLLKLDKWIKLPKKGE